MRIVKKIKNNFHSFKDVWLFMSIFFWATLLPVVIKFLSLPRTMHIITSSKTHKKIKNMNSTQEKVVRYTDYILNLNVWIWRTTCLKRSLLLYRFLNKIGMNVQVCFGVKYNKSLTSNKQNRNLDGHAWLLLNGGIFLERNIEIVGRYKMTYCFPSSQPPVEKRIY